MEQALLERRCDICLGFGGEFDDRISQHNVSNIELVLLARPEDLPASSNRIDINFLQERDLVGLKDSGPAADLVNTVLANKEIVPVEVVSAHTHYVAASLVSLGVGVAIVDEFTARSFVSQGLTTARFTEPLTLPFSAIHLSDTPQMSLVDDCVTMLARLLD
jgi:DNA-binding transcriptional LysR family regulator